MTESHLCDEIEGYEPFKPESCPLRHSTSPCFTLFNVNLLISKDKVTGSIFELIGVIDKLQIRIQRLEKKAGMDGMPYAYTLLPKRDDLK